MLIIIHKEIIYAAIEKCFDLARDVETIMRNARHIEQRAVGGVTPDYWK